LSSFPTHHSSIPAFSVVIGTFNVLHASFRIPAGAATFPTFVVTLTVTLIGASVHVAVLTLLVWVFFGFHVVCFAGVLAWVFVHKVIITVHPAIFAFHAWFRGWWAVIFTRMSGFPADNKGVPAVSVFLPVTAVLSKSPASDGVVTSMAFIPALIGHFGAFDVHASVAFIHASGFPAVHALFPWVVFPSIVKVSAFVLALVFFTGFVHSFGKVLVDSLFGSHVGYRPGVGGL